MARTTRNAPQITYFCGDDGTPRTYSKRRYKGGMVGSPANNGVWDDCRAASPWSKTGSKRRGAAVDAERRTWKRRERQMVAQYEANATTDTVSDTTLDLDLDYAALREQDRAYGIEADVVFDNGVCHVAPPMMVSGVFCQETYIFLGFLSDIDGGYVESETSRGYRFWTPREEVFFSDVPATFEG